VLAKLWLTTNTLVVRLAVSGNGEVVRGGDARNERGVNGALFVALAVSEGGAQGDVAVGTEGNGVAVVGRAPALAALRADGASASAVGSGNPLPLVEERAGVTLYSAVLGAVVDAKSVGGVVLGEEVLRFGVAVSELVVEGIALVLRINKLLASKSAVAEGGNRCGRKRRGDRRGSLGEGKGSKAQKNEDGGTHY